MDPGPRSSQAVFLPDGVLHAPLPKEPEKHGLEVTPVQRAPVGVVRVDIFTDHQHRVPACLAGPSKGHVAQEEGWQVGRLGFSCALFY